MAKRWDLAVLSEPVRFMWERIEASNGRAGDQMREIEKIIKDHVLKECARPTIEVFTGKKATLPGYYRTTKDWDLIVMIDGVLAAAIEVKSQRVGRPKKGGTPQVAKNVNNRIEEALGSATDVRRLSDERAASAWLGYLFVLEKAPETESAASQSIGAQLPVDGIFGSAPSIVRRYQILCQRLVQSSLYDGACILLAPLATVVAPTVEEPPLWSDDPDVNISFEGFMQSLTSHLKNFEVI